MTQAERTKWAFRWWKALEWTDDMRGRTSDGRWWRGDHIASMWLDGAPIEALP